MTREEAIRCIKHELLINVNRKDLTGQAVGEALDMAIEALQEPKIIVGIDTPYGSDTWIATVFKGKDDKLILEEVKEIMGWIPCSERLPKRDELVLVTYKTTDRIHLCRYLDDGSENPWWSYIDDCCAWNNVVLAWMPLPKPYREDGEDDGED